MVVTQQVIDWLLTQVSSTPAPDDLTSYFRTQGFACCNALLSRSLTDLLYRYMLLRTSHTERTISENKSGPENTLNLYAEPIAEEILALATPFFEKVVGEELYPTYSFMRVYKKGSSLARHTDRAACEYTVTLPLGPRSQSCWPIYLETPGEGIVEASLSPGNALIFKGTDFPHWRQELSLEQSIHLFLHYVAKTSRYAIEAYDRRPHLNTLSRSLRTRSK